MDAATKNTALCTEKPIKTAIIGMGMMGFSQFRNCFLPMKQYEVTAVCEVYEPNIIRFNEYCESHGLHIPLYTDYKEMLETADFDLAVIVTPDYQHEQQAIDCLKAGKHLRLEKPMAITLEGCERMIDTWKEHPQIVQIGYELRYASVITKMREYLPMIGTPKMIWCHEFRHPFLQKDGLIPNWITKKQYSGGTLLEKNCHHFDLFNMFAGSKPVSVYASGDNQVIYKETDVLDNAFVTVNYANGMRAMLSLCMFSPELKAQKHMHALEIGVMGDKGRMELKDDCLYVWDRDGKSETSYTYLRTNFEAHSEDILLSLEELANCIYENKQPYTDIYTGHDSARISLAAEKSAENGTIEYL